MFRLIWSLFRYWWPSIASDDLRGPPEKLTDFRDNFPQDNRFQVESTLGRGARGTTWLLQELKDGIPTRRFVVKSANHDTATRSIQKEIECARQLQGYAHIAQPITENGELISLETLGDGSLQLQKIYFVSEYLQNGSLDKFLDRSRSRANRGLNPVPNRVLWSIFRCSRMVIGMANPVVGNAGFQSGNVQTRLEQPSIFNLGTQPQIFHGDLDNLQNCLFGDYDAEEHGLVPILKVIDFGEATDDMKIMATILPPQVTANTITEGNIFAIGQIMQMLLGYFPTASFRAFQALRPNVDKDVYELANECANSDCRKRPSAFQLLQRIETNISNKKGPEDFAGKPFSEWESEERIRQYMNEIFDPEDI